MQNDKENLNTILDATFKFAQKTARDFYFNVWAKNPPKCSAFDGEVIHITQEGWEHITHSEGKTKTDILGRLFVLERAKILLEKAVAFTEVIERDKAVYWIFDNIIDEIKIKVVVKSYDKRPKYFLTVIKKGSVDTHLT